MCMFKRSINVLRCHLSAHGLHLRGPQYTGFGEYQSVYKSKTSFGEEDWDVNTNPSLLFRGNYRVFRILCFLRRI